MLVCTAVPASTALSELMNLYGANCHELIRGVENLIETRILSEKDSKIDGCVQILSVCADVYSLWQL